MDEQSRDVGTVGATDPGSQPGYVPVNAPAGRADAAQAADGRASEGPVYGPGADYPDPPGQRSGAAYEPAGTARGQSGSAYPLKGSAYGPGGAAYEPAGGAGAQSGSVYGPGGVAYEPAGRAGGLSGSAYGPAGAAYGAEPAGGGPPGERPKRRVRKAVVAGIAAAAVVVAGGIGFAATRDGNNSTSQQGGPGGGVGGAPGGGLAARGGPGGGLGSIAHGQVVVADSAGTFATRLVQTGTVSAVSASSITVQSADGYSATYTIGSDTAVDNGADAVTDIATGHTVMVLASTGKAAVAITDQNLFTGGQGGPPAQNGGATN